VGRILSVADVPGADRLYRLEVDIGKTIQLVAGIKKWYAKEELENRSVVVVANLEPAMIRGVESQGMLLAAESKGNVVLLAPDRDIEPGAKIR
jgi:methionyl-tRNA synthetase